MEIGLIEFVTTCAAARALSIWFPGLYTRGRKFGVPLENCLDGVETVETISDS